MYFVKFESDKNIIKLANSADQFADKETKPVESKKDLSSLLKLLNNSKKALVTIRLSDNETASNLFYELTNLDDNKLDNSKTNGSRIRDLSNIQTASSENTGKWDASGIPGFYALLRNSKSGLIYIGARKHTFSYYNVLCVPNDIAQEFMNDVSNTVATACLKTKSGDILYSVDTRDYNIHKKWNDFMDEYYEKGMARFAVS